MTSHYSCISISFSAQANLHLAAVAGVAVTGKNVLYKRRSGSTTHYRNTIQSVKYLSNRLVNKSVRYYWLVADYRSMSASLVYNLLIWASNISLLIKGAAQNTGLEYVRLIVNVGGGARLMRWSDQVTTGHTKCWARVTLGWPALTPASAVLPPLTQLSASQCSISLRNMEPWDVLMWIIIFVYFQDSFDDVHNSSAPLN